MNDHDKAKLHRMRAVMGNQRASQATDSQAKRDWEELAMDDTISRARKSGAGDDDDIEVA